MALPFIGWKYLTGGIIVEDLSFHVLYVSIMQYPAVLSMCVWTEALVWNRLEVKLSAAVFLGTAETDVNKVGLRGSS